MAYTIATIGSLTRAPQRRDVLVANPHGHGGMAGFDLASWAEGLTQPAIGLGYFAPGLVLGAVLTWIVMRK